MATAIAAKRRTLAPVHTRPTISTHLLQITPRQAREIIAHEVYPGQRAVRPHHVAFLRGLIARGHLRPGTLISFAVLNKTTRYLINGLQTLTALAQTQADPLWLQVEEIHVDTMDEVGQLYATYDRNLARSLPDLYRADPTLQQQALPVTHLRLLGGAVALLATGFTTLWTRPVGTHPYQVLLKDTQIRFALMAAWAEEWTQWQGAGPLGHGLRKHVERAAVLSVALVTYRFQPARAQQFWAAVRGDSGLYAGDPAHALLRFLRAYGARRYDSPTYARYVASAWNAAYAGRLLTRCTARGSSDPLVLQGTPHTGTSHLSYLTLDGTVVAEPVPIAHVDLAPAPPARREP